MVPSPPSSLEADLYYFGLPSAPRLVARTGTVPWKPQVGHLKTKELHPVGKHVINNVWEGNLALKVHDVLNVMDVKWTSTDVARIGNTGETVFPVVLWVGVMPGTLSGEKGVEVAMKCQNILFGYEIYDVEVELRESIVIRAAKLLTPQPGPHLTLDIYEPLTTSLGLPICAESQSEGGTGGFFITGAGKPNRLLLVTARHVVFPDANKDFYKFNDRYHKRHNILLFSDTAFNEYLESVKAERDGQGPRVTHLENNIRLLEQQVSIDHITLAVLQAKLGWEKKKQELLNTLYGDIVRHWSNHKNRILGHILLSPPIKLHVGDHGYTEDWAVIEVDPSKIDMTNFKGNVIDLGTEYDATDFNAMMHPNPRNPHSFEFPEDRLLKLRGIVPVKELCHLKSMDGEDEPCLMVLKRGNTSGLTIGRAGNITSYVRYYDGLEGQESNEWPIFVRDSSNQPFSGPGDSGSVVADGFGRIAGMLTGGTSDNAQREKKFDISYMTPIEFLLERMQFHGLDHLNISPTLDT